MKPVKYEAREGIAVLTLTNGVINAIGTHFVKDLEDALERVRQDREVSGVVFQSSNDKFFSIGLDIPGLLSLGMEEFASFIKSFNSLCMSIYTLPVPTVAAITGHAVAGGCILALCCDYRIIAEGRKLMGLNEIKLGLPLPYPAASILNHEMGIRTGRRIAETGEMLPPESMLALGMVDEIAPVEKVRERAVEFARQTADSGGPAFAELKRSRVQPVIAQVRQYSEESTKVFVDSWYSWNTQKLLREAAEKF